MPKPQNRKRAYLANSLKHFRKVTAYIHYESKDTKWNKRNNIWYNETDRKDIELSFTINPGEYIHPQAIRTYINDTEAHLDLLLNGYFLADFRLNIDGRPYQ